jgi:hypothetical protein
MGPDREQPLKQERLAADVVAVLEADPSVSSIWLVGSLGSPVATVDDWSDTDVGVVVNDGALADWSGAIDWLHPVGRVWAHETSEEPLRPVTRVVFHDGRRLDLVFFGHTGGRPDLAGRKIWSRDASSELARHAHLPSASRLRSQDAVDQLVNEFRFVGSLAVAKLARADNLVGLHLAIECARFCLVLGMLMRDDARPSGTWDDLPMELGRMTMPADVASALSGIEQCARIFETHLRAANYTQTLDAYPLEQMIAKLRATTGLTGTAAARN